MTRKPQSSRERKMYLFGISHECLYVETHHPSSVLRSRQEMRILLCLEMQTTPRLRVQGAGDSTQVHAHQPKCLSPSGGWVWVLVPGCALEELWNWCARSDLRWEFSLGRNAALLFNLSQAEDEAGLEVGWVELLTETRGFRWGEGDTASPGCMGTTESSWLVMTPGRRWTHALCLLWRSKRCSCEHPRPSHMFHLLFRPWVEKSSLLLWITPHSISFSFHLFHLFL